MEVRWAAGGSEAMGEDGSTPALGETDPTWPLPGTLQRLSSSHTTLDGEEEETLQHDKH